MYNIMYTTHNIPNANIPIFYAFMVGEIESRVRISNGSASLRRFGGETSVLEICISKNTSYLTVHLRTYVLPSL